MPVRKYSLVASLAVVLASQGCSLKIPTGLLNGSFLTPTTAPGGTVTTAGAACKDVFAKLDTNKDGSISEAEYKAGLALNSLDPATFDVSVEFKKRDANGDGKLSADEVAQGCTVAPGPEVKPPQPMPPIKKPPVTTAACTRGAIEVLDRYDANHNKSLEFEEFMGWYQAMARTQGCNGPIMDDDLPRIIEHGGGPNAGNIIANGAGGLQGQRHVMQQAGSTIAIAGHGVIISNNSGLLIAGQGGALITNNGGGLIANNGTGLVSGNGGGLISNNTGGWMTDGNGGTPSDPGINEGDMPRPMPACGPLPDPKTAFSKADLNGDGRIDLQELCQFPFFAPGVPIGIDPMPPVMPPIGNDCKNGFQRADLNHDGFVTPDEFFKARGVPFDGPQLNANQALPQAFVDAIMISNKGDFARRDRNGDGRIDGGEWCGYDPKPIPMPVPSYRPKPRPQPAECDLSYADLDGDGFVSWEEYYGANTPVFEGVDD
ncbi:MAG: EF-hand domain pair, partial [Cyanobacteria bacterium RYN_339]|nr:EF-hand domain pair [Cyanobacteria bacterium RYN_339]